MQMYLLDSVGFINSIPRAFMLFVLIWGLAEGLIIYFFRIRKFFSAVLEAVLVNLVSLIACFLTLYISEQEQWGDYTTLDLEASNELAWLALYLISVLIESLLLKALNKVVGWKKILLASIVMNFITFCILYFYVRYNQ